MLKILVLAGLVGVCFSLSCDSGNVELSKVGCLKRSSSVFPDMLANNRDTSSSVYTGHELDWNNYEQSLKELACACAEKAKEGGYVAFALGFYGECHGAKNQESYDNWLGGDASTSNNCINHGYNACNTNDAMCIGKNDAEFVYSFPSQAPEKIDGGYGEWSPLSECSKTCGTGIQERERVCNNPIPENGGADCSVLGEATETKSCKVKECPIDGQYGLWSSYGSCSKSCGEGSMTRTRQCNSPAPAHGGKQCSGDASQSKSCNSQPCLGSYSCNYKYTPFKTDSDGKAVYLDRHTLHCPSGQAIKEIRLERNSGHDKIRYRYKCCSAQLSCSDSLRTNGQSYNGGSEGNAVYLDRQTVNCYDKALSYLKLDRSGDNWNYKYDCCKYTYSKATVSCYNTNTGFSDDGDGNSVYLDRHNMSCNNNYFITKFKLERNSGKDKYRYDYRCCKVNTPSA